MRRDAKTCSSTPSKPRAALSSIILAAVSQAQFESIAEAGIWAPSADNRHQIEFELLGSAISLWATAGFTKAPFHRRVLGLIGLGAVSENMLIRASSLGFSGEVAWFPEPTRPDLLGRIDLRPGETVADELDAAIPVRCTNRRPFFHGPPMNESERESLEAEVSRVPGVRLLWFDQPQLRRELLRLLLIAESERFRSQPLHEELFASIRFDAGWNATADEGLPPGALEIEAPMRWLFKALRHWPLMRMLSTFGIHRLIGLRAAYVPARSAPHLCVLGTSLPGDEGYLAVGQALQRTWLRATAMNFAFQPFAAPGLLALHDYREVRQSVRESLNAGWKQLTDNSTCLLVFRIGRAAKASITAKRLSLSRYLRSLE